MEDQKAIDRIEKSIAKIDTRTEEIAKQLAAVDKTQAVDSDRLTSLLKHSDTMSIDVKNMARRMDEMERFKDRIEGVATAEFPNVAARVSKLENEKWKVMFAGVSFTIIILWEVGKALFPLVEKMK